MALIHVFDGLNHNTSYTFNGRLRDHIKGVDWENSIILRGGYRQSPDYEVQPDDIIYVRKTPAAATTVAIIAIAVVAVAAGVVAGVSIYQQKKAEKEMEAAQKAAKAGAEQTGKLPFVKGARNQAATGQTFPYVIGETLFTPYRLCPAHYTIAGTKGEEQFYNVVLECGYNNLVIDKIKMGETVIKAFNGDAPQNGEYSWDAGTYYDERNKIEIRQTGDFINADFNEKIVMTELTEEIPHDHASSDPDENARIEAKWQAGVVQELPSRPMKVELIALFDGLQRYDDGWKSQTITLQPQWTNNPDAASPTWHDFDTGFIQNGTASNTFEYNTKQQMRYSAVQTFTAAQAYGKKISVRVRRTTPKAESNAKDTVYLLAVQTTCYDAKKSTSSSLVAAKVLEDAERDKCTRLGIRVAANANTSGNLDAFSIITRACARTWNGSAWSNTRTPTSNLAAWVLEIMTSSKHAPSKYEDSELDLATFGEWYTYCQTQGFRADGVICRPTKKKSIIETLCRNGNAALVFNPMTGKIEVAIDNGRDYSIALLNSDTIQTISTTKEFKRKTTGKKVTYVNKDEDYDADSVIFMRDGGNYDPQTDTLTQTALEYITTYQHAFKYAWRQMAEEMAQPRVATVKVGREAAYYPIFSRVELQHKSLKIGLSHGKITGLKWQSGLLKEIYIEGTVTFPANVACGVIINCVSDSGRGLCALKVTGTGTTSTLTVTTTIRQSADIIPRAGDYFSFGKLDNDGNFTTVTNTMKITNAEETDDGYTLTLVDYNAALYTYGTLPEYKSNLTKTPDGSKKTVESQRDYVQQGEAEALASGAVQAAVDTTIKGVRFTNVYKVKPVEMSLEEIVAKMDADARNASASISISEDAILLKVEDLDEQQRAFISLTKSQILAQVDDMAQELTGLISVQAGAVTALVEGGGASGSMSLSLNLPIMIDATTRAKLVNASTEQKVAAVYALIEGTEYYGIKGNASDQAVKALWDDAVAGNLIASQIVLDADQVNIAGKTIFTKAASQSDATAKANAAQSAAEATAAADATAKRNDIAQKLGYTNWAAMEQAATNGKTIIDGGYLRTALIDVDSIFTKNLTLTGGSAFLQSGNFAMGKEGFRLTDSGVSLLNKALFAYDLEMPVVTNWIDDISDVEINMSTETGQAIKDKLDALIDAHKSPAFADNNTDSYVYANIVAGSTDNLYINYIPGIEWKEMLCHYLCRYTEGSITYYVIGSRESYSLFSLERQLLKVQNGTITKMSNNYGNTKILIKSVSDKSETFGEIYAREHLQGRLGHYVKRRGKVSSVNTALSTKGEVFDLLNKLLNGSETDGITLWYSDASDGMTARYPAMCSYTDSNKNKIRLYWHGGNTDFTQGDTGSTDKRYIWV